MDYRWIENLGSFQSIASEWDETLLLAGEDNPFLLSDFILTWWKYYSKNLKLKIFVAYQDDKIIGGLPLYQDNKGHLDYIGGIAANYTEFLSSKEKKSIIWKIFLKALNETKGWRCLFLRRYRSSRLNFEELRPMILRNKEILFDKYENGYSYLINIPQDSSLYLDKLSKNLRRHIRYSEKKLTRIGKMNLYTLGNSDELEVWSSKYIELSRNSFKRRKKESAFENEKHCLFFKELMRKMYYGRYLEANALKLDDKIIAINFGYSVTNNLNWIFPVFDINFARYHPGHLLLFKLVELGNKRKNRFIDLYSGYSRYKEEWSDYKEKILFIEVRPNSFTNRTKRLFLKTLRSVTFNEKVRQAVNISPVLSRIARRLKKFVSF